MVRVSVRALCTVFFCFLLNGVFGFSVAYAQDTAPNTYYWRSTSSTVTSCSGDLVKLNAATGNPIVLFSKNKCVFQVIVDERNQRASLLTRANSNIYPKPPPAVEVFDLQSGSPIEPSTQGASSFAIDFEDDNCIYYGYENTLESCMGTELELEDNATIAHVGINKAERILYAIVLLIDTSQSIEEIIAGVSPVNSYLFVAEQGSDEWQYGKLGPYYSNLGGAYAEEKAFIIRSVNYDSPDNYYGPTALVQYDFTQQNLATYSGTIDLNLSTRPETILFTNHDIANALGAADTSVFWSGDLRDVAISPDNSKLFWTSRLFNEFPCSFDTCRSWYDVVANSSLDGSNIEATKEFANDNELNFSFFSFLESDSGDSDTSVPGDANGDGITDFQDFLILSTNFGTQTVLGVEAGDFDLNGTVEFADFLILSANFNRTTAE